MAAHLLRVFAATLAAMILTLLAIFAALMAAAADAASPTQVANLALAEAFVDRAPLLIPAFVGLGGMLAIISLLFLLGLVTAAALAHWRGRPPSPDPLPNSGEPTGEERKRERRS